MENIDKAQALADKLDKLNQHFDITTSTVDELTNFVSEIEETPTEVLLEDEDEDILLPMSLLKKDFFMIRDTLIETISSGKGVIKDLAQQLRLNDGGPTGSVISAYAELVGVVNNSLKLLTSSYKDILELQKIINNKEDAKNVTINGDVNLNSVTNGSNLSDIIREMKKQSEAKVIEVTEVAEVAEVTEVTND